MDIIQWILGGTLLALIQGAVAIYIGLRKMPRDMDKISSESKDLNAKADKTFAETVKIYSEQLLEEKKAHIAEVDELKKHYALEIQAVDNRHAEELAALDHKLEMIRIKMQSQDNEIAFLRTKLSEAQFYTEDLLRVIRRLTGQLQMKDITPCAVPPDPPNSITK